MYIAIYFNKLDTVTDMKLSFSIKIMLLCGYVFTIGHTSARHSNYTGIARALSMVCDD